MNKKVLGVFLALCMLVAALPTAVFAKKTASDEIDEAIKAIKTNKNDVVVFNDMTMDEFLRAAAKVLPDDNTCTLSFEKEADYRIYNASSQKDGSIFANILFIRFDKRRVAQFEFIFRFAALVDNGNAVARILGLDALFAAKLNMHIRQRRAVIERAQAKA